MPMELWQLRQRQGLPLGAKVGLTTKKIIDWYSKWRGQVYVAFSGGKDSTVLLHLVHAMYPSVPAVFSNTGLEYPEIVDFVKNSFPHVEVIRPEMGFREVLTTFGYPVVSKRVACQIDRLRNSPSKEAYKRLYIDGITKCGEPLHNTALLLSKKWQYLLDAPFKISDRCCDVTKKNPLKEYAKRTGRKAILGVMAADSSQRESAYLQHGCLNFETGVATPMAFWTEEDVWQYIREHNLPYCPIYDTGVTHTGCIFCLFGVQFDKPENRFQQMYRSHPKLWQYCMEELGIREVLEYLKLPCKPADPEGGAGD